MDAAVSREIDLFAAAKDFKDAAALKAVAFVESAGVFFWTIDGAHVPAARFEGHYFYRILKKEKPHKLQEAVNAGLANPKAGAVKNPGSWKARYELINRAMKIDCDAAIRSVSWGIGQVMGDNARDLGYGTAEELMKDAYDGVKGQLEIMWRFIVKNGLLDEIKRRDWAGFAKVYNGPSYKKNRYDTQMAKAYATFSKHPVDGNIYLVQEKLKALGLYTDKVDGLYGPNTKAAVEKFQTAAGLVVDGDAGSVTIEQLDAFIASKKDRKTKEVTVPTLVGSGVIGTTVISQATQVMTQAQDIADTSKGLLETLNLPTIAVSLLVAAVVVAVVVYAMRRMRTDDSIEALDAVK